MKIVFAALLALAATGAFGQQQPPAGNSDDTDPALLLLFALQDRDYQNPDKIGTVQDLSKKVPDDTRLQLYQQNKSTGWIGLANPFFGAGSLIQSDRVGAGIVFGGIAAGVASIAYGSQYPKGSSLPDISKVSNPTYYTFGWIVLAAAIGYGFVEPWLFADKDNALMRNALLLPQ
jgi:hypothetical protein